MCTDAAVDGTEVEFDLPQAGPTLITFASNPLTADCLVSEPA